VLNCKGDWYSSPGSVQHYSSGFSIKMSEEMACAGTCRSCYRSTQNRCGEKYNIYFVANFLMHVTAKNYENWFKNKKVIAKIKRV